MNQINNIDEALEGPAERIACSGIFVLALVFLPFAACFAGAL